MRLLLLLLLTVSSSCWAGALNFQILGVDGKLKTAVERRLELASKDLPKNATRHEIEKLFTQSKTDITKTLRPYGYFRARVHARLIRIGFDWVGHYVIELGPQLRITKLHAKLTGRGKHEPLLAKYFASFPLHVGDPLIFPTYNQIKHDLFEIAHQSGYNYATLAKHKVLIDLKKYTAEITLVFETGEQYFFGDVYFSPTPLSDSFLRRYIHFKHGQPFSTSELLILQNSLNASNYFHNVAIKSDTKNINNHHIPVKIKLEPRKSQAYTVGAGYGTDTGPRGSLGIDWRYINSYGHHMNTVVQASPKLSRAQLHYVIPGHNPLRDQYHLSASSFFMDTPKGDSISGQARGAYVTMWHKWRTTFALTYLLDRSYNRPNARDDTSSILYPSLILDKRIAKDPINTVNGYHAKFTVQGASSHVVAEHSFMQVKAGLKIIRTITPRTRVVVRGQAGYTDVGKAENLPLSLQFLTGGSASIRGYKYQSLGPGKYLAVASAELQRTVFDKWFAAGFYDAGNVFNHLSSNPSKTLSLMRQTYGFGIGRRTKIGPVQVSLARAVNSAGMPWKIVFAMGPDL